MRQIDNVEFPITLGRDFCGKIVSKGLGEYNVLPIGSRVWGVVPVHQQGSHAEYVVVDAKLVCNGYITFRKAQYYFVTFQMPWQLHS